MLNFLKKSVNNLPALSLQGEHYKKIQFSLRHAAEEKGGRTNGRLMYMLCRLGIWSTVVSCRFKKIGVKNVWLSLLVRFSMCVNFYFSEAYCLVLFVGYVGSMNPQYLC